MQSNCKCKLHPLEFTEPTMPIYVYETIPNGEGEPTTRFEIMQRMSEPALSIHPETGEEVQRVITAPALALKYSSGREREVLSDDNLSRHGFSRYQRVGEGNYERTAGNGGPRRIRSK